VATTTAAAATTCTGLVSMVVFGVVVAFVVVAGVVGAGVRIALAAAARTLST